MGRPLQNSQTPVLLLGYEGSSIEDDCACAERVLMPDLRMDMEQDCACAAAIGQAVDQSPGGELFQATSQLRVDALPEGFRLVFGATSRVGPVALNEPAWSLLQSYHEPQPLNSETARQMAAAGLLRPASGEAVLLAGASSPEALTVWMHLSNACNLSCPYCYVRKSSSSMRLETGLRALESIFRTAQAHEMRIIKLKYAGGESMLHFELVRALHEAALRIAREARIELREVVLSNGTCIGEPEAEWFHATGVKLMISLDGVGADHDRLRSDVDGQGTFARIERAVDDLLLPRGVTPIVSVTISGANAHAVKDVVHWALVRHLPVSLNFYRPSGPAEAPDGLALEDQRIIAGMREAYRVIEEHLPERPLFNGLLDRVRIGQHDTTCGVGRDYLVITEEGQLAQCHMRLGDVVGDGLDGDLLERVAAGSIRNLLVEEKAGCQKCLYRYFCTGGCPLETFRTRGRWDARGPNCAIYQALIPDALRLEGLRLMKQAGYL